MSSNRYKYFRWTPRTARITFAWVVVVPSMVGYAAYKTDVSRKHQCHTFHNSLTSMLNAGTMGFPGKEERRPARGAVDELAGWQACIVVHITGREQQWSLSASNIVLWKI
jgi:hypothetical protein